MSRGPQVIYWTMDAATHNFGDYLTAYFLEHALIAPLHDIPIYRLIGSVIDDAHIQEAAQLAGLGRGVVLGLWGCGMRDTAPLREANLCRAKLFGVRGPLTRGALGLPSETPIGDPALTLPYIYTPKPGSTKKQTVCIPHINDPKSHEDLLQLSECDALRSAGVATLDELEALIDDIASADFVLCGALHAAIVACAYGRPFAFWDTGSLDLPYKWLDFAASVGIKAEFAHNLAEGLAFSAAATPVVPSAVRILTACPFAVRPSVIVRALAAETGLDEASAVKMVESLANTDHENLTYSSTPHTENPHEGTNVLKEKFDRYRAFAATSPSGGGLPAITSALWMHFLAGQTKAGVAGDMLEIGVWHGYTASLLASELRETERLGIVDIAMTREIFGPQIKTFAGDAAYERTDLWTGSSFDLKRRNEKFDALGDLRWVHIDGEHSYEAIENDFLLINDKLADLGVIVFDDIFFDNCPQLTTALFDLLRSRRTDVVMFAIGMNKAYLCRPRALAFYRELTRQAPIVMEEVGQFARVCASAWSAEATYYGVAHRPAGDPKWLIMNALTDDVSQVP